MAVFFLLVALLLQSSCSGAMPASGMEGGCTLCISLKNPRAAAAASAACTQLQGLLQASDLKPLLGSSRSTCQPPAEPGKAAKLCVELEADTAVVQANRAIAATKRNTVLQALMCSTAPKAQLYYTQECQKRSIAAARSPSRSLPLLSCSSVQSVLSSASSSSIGAGRAGVVTARASATSLLRGQTR